MPALKDWIQDLITELDEAFLGSNLLLIGWPELAPVMARAAAFANLSEKTLEAIKAEGLVIMSMSF